MMYWRNTGVCRPRNKHQFNTRSPKKYRAFPFRNALLDSNICLLYFYSKKEHFCSLLRDCRNDFFRTVFRSNIPLSALAFQAACRLLSSFRRRAAVEREHLTAVCIAKSGTARDALRELLRAVLRAVARLHTRLQTDILPFGQLTLHLNSAMPLTEWLFNTRLRREDRFNKQKGLARGQDLFLICFKNRRSPRAPAR